MAVAKLIGKIDNHPIEFTKVGTKWVSTFSTNIGNGEYLLKLEVHDDAGNVGHYMDVRVLVDSRNITMQVLNSKNRSKLINEKLDTNIINDLVITRLLYDENLERRMICIMS